MFESNLAELEALAAPEAASEPVASAGKVTSECEILTDLQSVALLESSTTRLRRRRTRIAQFRDDSAALFRPFRIY